MFLDQWLIYFCQPLKPIPKPLNFGKRSILWRLEKGLKLQEIETASSSFKICPKCNSREGFWLGIKGDHIHAQCKCCGARFELHEVYKTREESAKPKLLRFFRK
jgi:hypothetical protein